MEPTSKPAAVGMLAEIGAAAPHRNTFTAALRRCVDKDYRATLATAVTTLHFEAGNEDALRKVGMSKERRVDPQIRVGLLVDPSGFPLEVSCCEGSTAETTTLLPVRCGFAERHTDFENWLGSQEAAA